jgi:hypothetical protein
VPPPTVPARAIAQEMRHKIPSGTFTQAEALFSEENEAEMSKPEAVQKIPILKRRIRCVGHVWVLLARGDELMGVLVFL